MFVYNMIRQQIIQQFMSEQKHEKIGDCNTENTESPCHSEQPFFNRIIQSTEEIINSQAIKIFQLTNEVKELRKEHALLQSKYDALLRVCGKDESARLDDIVGQISVLEGELVIAKTDLALCKAQNLEIKFAGMRTQKITLANSLQQIRFPQVEKLQGYLLMHSKNPSAQQSAGMGEWNKLTETYLLGYPRVNRFKQKTYELLRKGIPQGLRQSLWPLLFGNKVGITDNLYSELLNRKQKDENYSRKVLSQIDKDICRSFNGKTKFDSKVGLCSEVTQILEVFHIYRPDVSYVQGMTYPAIVLTLIVGKYKAFAIFCNLIVGNQFFRRLYTFQSCYLTCFCRSFDFLLEEKSPRLYKLLEERSVHSQIFLVEWFYTFFSRGLSYEFTLKLWDYLAYQQELLFFKLAISILELLETHLSDSSPESAVGIIRQFGSYISESKLQQTLIAQKLTDQKLEKTFDRVLRAQNKN